MEVRFSKCPECGTVFPRILDKNPLCDDCRDIERAEIDRIEKALESEPLLTADELAEATGLPLEIVARRMPSAIIEVPEELVAEVPCERCEKRVADPGTTHCFECRMELLDEIRRINNELFKIVGPRQYSMFRSPRNIESLKALQAIKNRAENSKIRLSGWRKRPRIGGYESNS